MQFTDPALELAETCTRLLHPSGDSGENVLSKEFGVNPWSREFYEIIFTILDRADFIAELIEKDGPDHAIHQDAIDHINGIKLAFSRSYIGARWDNHGQGYNLLKEHTPPIRMLSFYVRSKISYPRLTKDEISECLELIDDLIQWLEAHQLAEQDFIRQALTEGLGRFRSRLALMEWLGWGYTIESLRAVIGAYLALERGISVDDSDTMASAIVNKTMGMLKALYQKLGATKEFVDRADFLLRAYGFASVVKDTGIAGLLTHARG